MILLVKVISTTDFPRINFSQSRPNVRLSQQSFERETKPTNKKKVLSKLFGRADKTTIQQNFRFRFRFCEFIINYDFRRIESDIEIKKKNSFSTHTNTHSHTERNGVDDSSFQVLFLKTFFVILVFVSLFALSHFASTKNKTNSRKC